MSDFTSEFTGGVGQKLRKGDFVFATAMSSGSVTLSMKIGDGDYVAITDGALTSTQTSEITLPDCTLKADITGDATFTLSRLSYYYT